jgi:hypothetical protein
MRDLIGAIFTRRRASDWPSLVEAIRAGAAFLAQGSSYSYLRARSLLAGPRLFQDEGFGFALQICKWEAFAVAAQDLILILDAELRRGVAAQAHARAAVLADLYDAVLAAEAMPEHRRQTGWEDLRAGFAARLVVVLAAPPQRPDAIARATAEAILRHAPIDDLVRAADREMVVNNVAFRFIDHQSRMRREFDLGAVGAMLEARIACAA